MKKYFLFVGQNATTGIPNTKTGRMTQYGDILRFKTEKIRNDYINNLFSVNNPIIVKGGIDKMRQFCLGMSVSDFYDYINSIDFH